LGPTNGRGFERHLSFIVASKARVRNGRKSSQGASIRNVPLTKVASFRSESIETFAFPRMQVFASECGRMADMDNRAPPTI
jgi:hypothetical protein